MLRQSAHILAAVILIIGSVSLPVHGQKKAIEIVADLTDAPRKLYHAEVDLPVNPGPLTLTTPRWIPGNHRPTGPVSDITGVVFSVNGQAIEWRRDDVDMYEFHVNIPAGVSTLHAHLDCIVTARLSQKMAVSSGRSFCFILPTRPCAIFPSSLR